MASNQQNRKDNNPDIGEHPVGTGVGAAGGGAAGAAIGMAGGPVGMAIGAAAGAIAGGLGGKAITDAAVNPDQEHAYWRENYKSRPYAQKTHEYDHYAPAYQYGWESSAKHSGKRFDEVETDLRSNWETTHGSRMGWDSARLAVRDAYDRVGTSRTSASTTGQQGQVAVPVTEERLQVGKQEVETGGVRVRTEVQERPVEAQVNLREEHVNVQRRPVDRPASEADFARASNANIEVTETAEQAVVAKQARVVEEVIVGKEATERTETVRDTVRRTDVEVERVEGNKTNVDQASMAADVRRDAKTNPQTGR